MSMGYTKALTVDTDTTFAGNSTTGVPSQSAVKNLYDNVNVANAAYIKTALNASGSAPIYACRAWAFFSTASGTVSLTSSGNVSSITDGGTGFYTVNFSTSMPDVNYVDCPSVKSTNNTYVLKHINTYTKTVSSCQVYTGAGTSETGLYDQDSVSIAFFR